MAGVTWEEVAASLSKAQKAYLTTKAKYQRPTYYTDKRWMTFPPPNTHRVLMQLELVDMVGQITDKGMQVRRMLEEQSK